MVIVNRDIEDFFVGLVKCKLLAVSTSGDVFNLKTGRLIGAVGSGGYMKLSYMCAASKKILSILTHRLVYLVHVGGIPDGFVINHRDGDKLNNSILNLEIVTPNQNAQHASSTGLLTCMKAQNNPNAIFSNTEVEACRYDFSRGKITILSICEKFRCHKLTAIQMLTGETYSSISNALDKRTVLTSLGPTNMLLSDKRKANDALKLKIIKMYAEGLSDYQISKKLDVHRSKVQRLRTTK